MTIGSTVVLKEAVIVVNVFLQTDFLPKGTQGVIEAENGSFIALGIDGVRYADIPIASVEILPEAVTACV